MRAIRDRRAHFREACLQRCLPRWERRGDRCHFHPGASDATHRVPHHRGIDAHRGSARDIQALVRRDRLAAERCDFPRRVFPFERGEIDHRDRELQAEELRLFLDAPRRVFRHALLDADGIHRADMIHEPAECAWGSEGHLARLCGHEVRTIKNTKAGGPGG